MKHILYVFALVVFFVGCAQNEQVVYLPSPSDGNYKNEVTQKTNSVDTFESSDHTIQRENEEVIVNTQLKPKEKVKLKPFRIALVYPSKEVGSYAKEMTNTIFSYLLYQDKPYEFEVFDTTYQTYFSINKSFKKLEEKGFDKAIILFTSKGANILKKLDNISSIDKFFPLLNKKENNLFIANSFYGGIDYKAQLEKLVSISNKKRAIFYDNSFLGMSLKNKLLASLNNKPMMSKISANTKAYKKITKNKYLNGRTIFLNTPIIKSSILLSQLRANEINPYNVLSTQLNFNPLLLSLTQRADRKKFIVANSISSVNSSLEETTKFLESDIIYNWVSYSSLVGVDYLYSKNNSGLLKDRVRNSQVNYGIELLKYNSFGYKKY